MKQTTKKYRERMSPPYKADDFRNRRKKGNDGFMYVSEKREKSKVFRWYRISNQKKKIQDCNVYQYNFDQDIEARILEEEKGLFDLDYSMYALK
jgi:hypothetical protein